MGSLNLPVRDQTCLRSLLWFALQLMLLLRLRLMPRLMLDFCMEDMVMDLDLAMLDTDMVLELMDTLDLDIMARDQLMLSLKPRLMLVFCMEDMDMDLVWDMLVWDIVVLDMVVLDMPDMVDMDILIMVKLYLLSFLKQKLKVISDWQCIIQCPCLKGRN